MNEKMRQAREAYESVPIPAELSARMNAVVKNMRRKRIWKAAMRTAVSLAGCAAAFVLAVRLNPAVAAALEPVPVLGELARVVTGWSYQQEDEKSYLHIQMPMLQHTGNSALEQRVNQEIQARVDHLVEEARRQAQEEYSAWLATRQEGDDFFLPVDIQVDYQVHCSTEDVLSFEITVTRTRANAYTETSVYNIRLDTGEAITLEELLGEQWQEIANEAVKEGIARRSREPGSTYYTLEQFGMEFTSISDDQTFYLNEAGNPVIVFDKYEIAPGYMGRQEFEIPLPQQDAGAG